MSPFLRILPVILLATTVRAALPSLADTVGPYTQDFNGLPSAGTADFSILPEGWTVLESGTGANTSLAADSGSSNSGNTYSYGSTGSTDRALGLLASGSVTGRIQFRIVNASGKVVDSVRVRFSAEQWRLGSGTTDSMAATIQAGSASATPVPALTIRIDQGNTNLANPTANANPTTIEATIATAIAAGDTLVLTWNDVNAAGNDDGWAIDDFQLRFAHFGTGAPPPPPPPQPSMAIHAIQGAGTSSPYLDSIVNFTGIATSAFQAATRLKGFHVQTPDGLQDADVRTSEGIFVYVGSQSVAVAMGDSVQVVGKVAEFSGLTEITSPTVTILASGKPLPATTSITLPLDSAAAAERWEGMRVQFPQSLVVTGNYTLARYGEMVVAPRRQMAPTQVAHPGIPAQAAMRADSLARLVVNDASNIQNPAAVPYPSGGLSASNTLRTGTIVDGLVGVLDYAFGLWTLQPTQAPSFTNANPRTSPPAAPTGHLRVASFNVLNYFTTLGTPTSCGPLRTLECRGATDSVEFRRQKAKILSAIRRLDADIVGLMEIENHPDDSALLDLVKGLNDSSAPGTWTHVSTGPLGGDAIKVALIYRPSRVQATDSVARLTRSIDPEFVDTLNRVPLARTFLHAGSGQRFTVVVNHLKSKGSACSGDPDAGDGQGNCNQVRARAARALARWTKSRPTGTTSPHVLLLGDFNAYAQEDPIAALQDSGFVNIGIRDEGDSSYSYQFGNAFGTLDHALATGGLAGFARAKHWAINADEPVALGYNREFKSAGQIDSFFQPDPYASSDHDPVLVDLDFSTVGVVRSASPAPRIVRNGAWVTVLAAEDRAGSRFEIVSLSGRRLAAGVLDKSAEASIRLPSHGVAVLRMEATGSKSLAERIAIP